MKFLFRRRASSIEKPAPTIAVPIDEWIAEGNRLEDGGDVEGAMRLYERAAEAVPDAWRAWVNLGNALHELGRFGEAAERHRRAIAIHPDSAAAHQNLGNALLAAGDAEGAADAYRDAVRLKPDGAEAWLGLGSALETAAPLEAIAAFEKAVELDARHPMAAALLARQLLKEGNLDRAASVLDAALAQNPANAAVLAARANFEKELGQSAHAVTAYRKALAMEPGNLATWSAYLFALNFDEGADANTILDEHRKFGDALAARVSVARSRRAHEREKRLRIGYLSPDFRRHSVACFIEPLLRHHDRSAVEVHCYYTHTAHDDITRRFIALADAWHDIVTLDDAAVSERIADDGIDILVDLAGHTGNRLGVFARKPAPLQFTWLGYLCTTGVAAIDYRLCDAYTDPMGVAEQWQVERPARLPNAQWCYQPQAPLPAPTPLPRSTRKYWTFGSFNQVSKLNPSLLQHWAQLLIAIPDSRLRIVGVTNARFEDNTRAIFDTAGIAYERLEFVGRLPIDAYFTTYADVDVALDSSPYNGATTTCDALLMGVPVVAVAGERAISRSGVSLLSVLGLDDWIAPSHNALVPMLQGHLKDPNAIARLRAALPDRMRASALMDGPRFAHDVEAIFRNAWIERCATSP